MAKNDWRCNCGYACASWASLLSHIKRDHPENGYWAWNINRDLGDKFANNAMKRLQDNLVDAHRESAIAKEKAELYDKLLPRFNSLARTVQQFQLSLLSYQEAHEKEGK